MYLQFIINIKILILIILLGLVHSSILMFCTSSNRCERLSFISNETFIKVVLLGYLNRLSLISNRWKKLRLIADFRIYKFKTWHFSDLGIEIHTVAFSNDMNDGLIIYLSNWIKRLMPIGLVPDMRVIVKNVLANSKYIKPTVFTSFEIVAYEPKVPFQTVNL